MRGGTVAGGRRRTVVVTGPANVIIDGDFNSVGVWQEFGYSGKSVSGGKALFTASPAFDGFKQPVTVTAGKYYQLVWTISGRTAGSVYARLLGGTTRNATSRTANGTYTERIQANTGNNIFEIILDVTGTLAIDDVSLTGPYDTATVGGA